MTTDKKIEILRNQRERITSAGITFHAWFNETIPYYEDIFGGGSTQFRALNDLKTKFFVTGDWTDFFRDAKELVNGHIMYLQTKKSIEGEIDYKKKVKDLEFQVESKQMDNEALDESIQLLHQENRGLQQRIETLTNNPKVIVEKPKEVWWKRGEAVLGLCALMLTLGYYFGTAKFDREKLDLNDLTITQEQELKRKDDTIKILRTQPTKK